MKDIFKGLKIGIGIGTMILLFSILSFSLKAVFDSDYQATGGNTVLTEIAWNQLVKASIWKEYPNIATDTSNFDLNCERRALIEGATSIYFPGTTSSYLSVQGGDTTRYIYADNKDADTKAGGVSPQVVTKLWSRCYD